VIPGHHVGSILELARFDKQGLADGFRRNLVAATKRHQLADDQIADLTQFYEKSFYNYTYLE
jgi:hypothetical protein